VPPLDRAVLYLPQSAPRLKTHFSFLAQVGGLELLEDFIYFGRDIDVCLVGGSFESLRLEFGRSALELLPQRVDVEVLVSSLASRFYL
jgi:hypothetical protein